MEIDRWNHIVDLIEAGYQPGKYTKLRREMDWVLSMLDRPMIGAICAEHLVEMTEYKPGFIRCDMCHPKGNM